MAGTELLQPAVPPASKLWGRSCQEAAGAGRSCASWGLLNGPGALAAEPPRGLSDGLPVGLPVGLH